MPSEASPDDYAYCARQARAHDYDRYLAALTAPNRLREHLLALIAFNDELARVRDAVTEPALGDIRFAWWREAVNEGLTGGQNDHPVARALATTVRVFDLDGHYLHAMIDTRARDLDDEPFRDIDELEAYADGTSANLAQLMLGVLGASDANAMTAGRRIGTAWGLIAALKTMPLLRGRGRNLLSGELAFGQVMDKIDDHLVLARGQARHVPRKALPAMLSAVIGDMYVERLRHAGEGASVQDLYIMPLPRTARVIWRWVLGRY